MTSVGASGGRGWKNGSRGLVASEQAFEPPDAIKSLPRVMRAGKKLTPHGRPVKPFNNLALGALVETFVLLPLGIGIVLSSTASLGVAYAPKLRRGRGERGHAARPPLLSASSLL